MTDSTLPPPVDRSHNPPLHQLDWQKWERLTVAVFEREPDIATVDAYGTSGQQQYGIDVIGRRSAGDGEEVVSCKLTETITPRDLTQWSDDFLKHWDAHWREWSVRRFILATTATNTANRRVHDQVRQEQARFQSKGIQYELWGPSQFTAKLRAHRAIVSAYLSEAWTDIICGPSANQAPEQTGATNLLPQAAIAQLDELQRALSGQAVKRAEEAIEALRTGNRAAVHELVNELRSASVWTQLVPQTQAQVIRLQAALSIHEDRLDDAAAYAVEARKLEPEAERRMEAQIALQEVGPDAALTELGEPTSIQGRQLKATLFLMTGADDEAEALLDMLHRESQVDAETWRLIALHRIAHGQRAAALEAVQKAEAIAGHWIAVLQAGIIVRYAHSLSPVIGREWLFYPNPIDTALVAEDAGAQPLLEDALRLSEIMARSDTDRADAALWKLAVLSNLKGRQEAASNHARTLLAERPAEPTVIAWCVNRQLDVDLTPSLRQLKSDYARGSDLMANRVLGLLLINLEPEDGGEFLAAHLDAQEPQARAEAELWITRIRGGPEDGEHDSAPVALRRSRETSDWREVIELARARLNEDPPHIEGFTLAQALAEAQEWSALLEFAERLPLYATATAVRLTAYILFNNQQYEPMLALLEEQAERFGETLPEDLRRLRAEALLRTGRPQDSLRELERMGSADSLELKLLGAEVRVRLGDVRATVPVVREALRSNKLEAAHALHWSQILQTEEPELARQLWRHAMQGESRERLAIALMDQAFRLGLDSETALLMPEVQARAAAGSPEVRTVSLDEMKELMETWRAGAADISEKYLNGALPAHLAVRGDEAAYLRLLLERSDPTDQRLRPRLIRSGARPAELKIDEDWSDLAIHLDISALILADHIGLLDLLEQTNEPVRVSPQLPAILLLMERGAQPIQPSEADARRAAWSAFADGWVEFDETAEKNEHTLFLVEGDAAPPVDALIRALESAGILGADEAREALACVGDQGSEALSLDEITALRIDNFAILSLARAGLLPLLRDHFRLQSTSGVRRALQAEIERGNEQDRLAGIVKKLRQRVADNLAAGRFIMLEPASDPRGYGQEPTLVAALQDLLVAPHLDHGIVWIDDRLISSYSQTATMPAVGIFEILQTLAAQGRLTQDEYREKLSALRELGACFIPFHDSEIMVPLRSASSGENGVRETRDLQTVRRNFSAAGRLEANLQIGTPDRPNPNNRPDEFEYPRSAMRLLGDCLTAIWTYPPIDVERAYAESDWLWRNLRVTNLNRLIPGDNPEAAQDRFEAMQVAHLLDKAIDIGGLRDERNSLREAYLNWTWGRCVRPTASADPAFLDRIGNHLADLYGALIEDARQSKKDREGRILSELVLLRLQRLPEPIRRRVIATGQLVGLAGVHKTITLGRVRFDPVAFWRAVRRAHRYGKARLRTTQGRLVRITRVDHGLRFGPPVRAHLVDELNDLVAARREELRTLIPHYLATLGLDPDAHAEVLTNAYAAYGQPHRLADVFTEYRESAPIRRYHMIAEKLGSGRPFDSELLFPASADRLVRHFGLTETGEGAIRLQTDFERLKGALGIQEALRRLGGIPVQMSSSAFADLDDDGLLALVQATVTPVPLIQLLAEATRREGDSERLSRVVERLVRCIENVGELQIALLRWTEKSLRRDPSWLALPQSLQLALVWVHADQLMRLFVKNRSAPEPLVEFLNANPPALSTPPMLFGTRGDRDQGSPGQLSPTALLYHGLGAAFGDRDLTSLLPEETIDRLFGILRVSVQEVVSPEFSLMRRRRNGPDAMNSFLRDAPVGVLDGNLDPEATRDALVDAAIDGVQARRGDAESSWTQLAAFAMMGMNEVQRERMRVLLQSSDIFSLAFGMSEFQPVRWRALLGGLVETDREMATQHIFDLAAQCDHRSDHPLGPNEAGAALEQLVELAAMIAADDASDPTRRLSDLLFGIALAWPASVRRLRTVVDNLLATTPAREATAIWQLHYQLGSMP